MPRKNLRVVLEGLRLVRAPVELHLVGSSKIPGGTVDQNFFSAGRLI